MIVGLMVLWLAACNGGFSGQGVCGDGRCSNPENDQNCPADCAGIMPLAATDGPQVTNLSEDAPFFITTMTHMEGNFNDDQNRAVFERHVNELRYGMDLAEEYGALLTIESEKPFARANTLWNLNMMAEIRDRGFGVGTHCDIGYKSAPMPVEQYAQMFRENKQLVDELVGEENNLGCSGGGSVNDWALAASMAGFRYLDGIVAMHYLSMPIENRPGVNWTDEFIRDGHFHLNAPVDLSQRIYPIGVSDAKDFAEDANAVIVVSSGELGLLSALAERGREVGGGPILSDDEYVFDKADVDQLVGQIRSLAASRDRSRVAKVTVYLPVYFFSEKYETELRYFFAQMEGLQNEGVVQWATQRQVYEAYIERR